MELIRARLVPLWLVDRLRVGRFTVVLIIVAAGLPLPATFKSPPELFFDRRGRLWIFGNGNRLVRPEPDGVGTEVELRIPGSVAYMPSRRLGSARRLLGGFVRKDSPDER